MKVIVDLVYFVFTPGLSLTPLLVTVLVSSSRSRRLVFIGKHKFYSKFYNYNIYSFCCINNNKLQPLKFQRERLSY